MKGLVTDIQRFSIQDGPGIRTTVFLKGCPLKCKWCSNPESQNANPDILVDIRQCNKCGKCLEACPREAISLTHELAIDRKRCDLCLKCVEACSPAAIILSGKYMDINEIVMEIKRDELFYKNSGGGVTLSGGEPLSQPEFTYSLLKSCQENGLHTATDTCGYAPSAVFDRVLAHTDLLLFDIKHMDSEEHRIATGKKNKLIISNLCRAADRGARIWLRVPLIPGYNDSTKNMRETAELAIAVKAEKLSLLPYHEWGKTKYTKLNRRYTQRHNRFLSKDDLQRIKSLIEESGLNVSIGS